MSLPDRPVLSRRPCYAFAVLLVLFWTRLGATLPDTWSDGDIGTVGTPGGAAYDAGTDAYTIQGAGSDIGGTADNFHFTYRLMSGDGTIVARIASLTNTSSTAKAGVMIRETLAAGSKHALMMVTPGSGVGIKWRDLSGASTSQVLAAGALQAPRWVKLERRGKMVTGYESADGLVWNVVQRVALSMSSDVYVGLAACSRTTGLMTAVADHILVDTPNADIALPWPWVEDTVGTPLDPGAAIYDGSYVLSNLGADTWGTADKMKFVSQTLTGDGALTVKVSSVASGDDSSRLVLMMRKTLDANSQDVVLGVKTAKSLLFFSRPTTGGTSALLTTAVTVAVPVWLRLERSGNVFTALRSSDGVTWTQYGSTTINMGPSLHVGLAYSNHSSSVWAIGVGDSLQLTSAADADGNGLDDAWETHYFGHTGVDPQADPDGDGLPNSQEWELGNDPLVFNLEGQHPLLELASGDNQFGPTGTLLPQPLVVKVTDSLSGGPMANVPVLMSVNQGNGLLGASPPGSSSLGLFSDANGLVQSSFMLPVTGGLNVVGASIGGRQQAGVVTFNLDALVGEAPLLFETADLGAPALPSQVQYDDGTFTLKGANVVNNSGTSDRSTFVWRDLTGDGYMLARAAFVDATDPYAQTGLVIRAGLDANAPDIAMLLTRSNGVAFQWRDTVGGATGVTRTAGISGPVWLLLRRSGNIITGFYSTDGQTWLVGGARTLAMNAVVKVGFTLGTKTTVYNSATFDGLRMGPLFEAPWLMADIGSPKATAVDDYAEDSIFVRAGGTDITGTSDAFHYIYQPLTGDGRFVVRVDSQLAVQPTTKSCLMIRESLATNSRNVALMLTPVGGVTLRSRAQTGGTTVTLGNIPAVAAPYWLRLDRVGGRIDAYASADGETWTPVGSTAFDPGAAPLIGLAASSNIATTHTQTLFDHLQLATADGARGWNATYFEGTAFDISRTYRRDANIDFTWPAGQAPAPNVPADGFSVRWEGNVVPDYSEDYALTAVSQGSARVTVDGQVVVDAWTPHGLTTAAGHVTLQAGQPAHVVVEYAKASGDGRMQLRWSSSSQPDAPVPFTSVHPVDSDDDGMPDAWETAHGLDPLNPADAALDADGDGLNNLLEYQLGGNPTLADDRLSGVVVMEEWTGIAGANVRDLTGNAKFYGAPDSRRSLTTLEVPRNRADNFGVRVRGYIVPPVTGAYQFWVAADERAEFWLSTGDSPFNRVQVARVSEGITAYRDFGARVEQRSHLITLQAGHYYYFEALQKESTSSDNLTVAWTRPGASAPEIIPGSCLATFADTGADADGDGLPDTWEAAHGLNAPGLALTARGAYGNADDDRLVNLLEYQRGTDPLTADTDGDGQDDYLETLVASDPLVVSALTVAPWLLDDVGAPVDPSIVNRIGDDAFQMAGMRAAIGNHRDDTFRYLYHQVSGDFEFTTRVVQPASLFTGYAGISVRSSLASDAVSLNLLQDATGLTRTLVRTSSDTDVVELTNCTPAYPNATVATGGDWIRVRREGALVRLYYSIDGQSWLLANTRTLNLGEDCLVGMTVGFTTTGTGDTGFAVRQFTDVRLVTDLTPPASPETVPPEATATVIETLNGNAGVTVDGQWAASGNDLVSEMFTGKLDYTFTVPADGLYRLKFTALSTSNSTPSTLFPVEISVDGQFVGRVDLVLPLDEEGIAQIVAPWLKAGTHMVRFFYDNTLSYHPITLRSLTVEELGGGADADGNGRADWIDARLQALNTIATAGSGNLYASPACLDGQARFRSLFQLTADGQPVTVNPAPGFGWYADVPLGETSPVEVSCDFENSGTVQGVLLTWASINLLAPPEDLPGATITIRKGDSLRFTACPSGATGGTATVTVATDGADPVVHTLADPQGAPVAQVFDAAGSFTVTGVYTDASGVAAPAGTFAVEVVEASFASDPVVGLNNTPVTWDNPDIFDNALVEVDQGLLLLKQGALSGGGTRFSLSSSNVDDSIIIARIGEGGPILGHATVHSLRAATVSDTAMDVLTVYPDGSQLIGVPIIVNRLDDDTRVVVDIFVAGVTFDDGTVTKTLTKADFDAYGRVYLKFIYPPGVAVSICHRVEIYEGDTDLGQF